MICRVCGSAMELDALVVQDAVRELDPGSPIPMVYRCLHGHSARRPEARRASPSVHSRLVPRCAWCGVEVPRRPGAAPPKSCGRAHRNLIERKRAEAAKLHHATGAGPFTFLIEAQPWYRGASTVFQPKAIHPVITGPVWPLFPEIPDVWMEGFRAVYPALEAEPTFSIVPSIDDAPAMTAFSTTRRYGRRRSVPKVRDESRLAWPHP